MCWINALSFIVAFVAYGISAYFIGSLTAVLFFVVFVVFVDALNSILIERAMLSRWVACDVYFAALMLYLLYYHRYVMDLVGQAFSRLAQNTMA